MKEETGIFHKEKSFSLNENEKTTTVNQILSQYPNGLQSLLDNQILDKEDLYILFVLNCPDFFSASNSKMDKNKTLSVDFSISLKYFVKHPKNFCDQDIDDENNNKIFVENENYKNLLNKIFSKFFDLTDISTEEIIQQYLILKSSNTSDINYEDFIFIFCSIIRYYTGLNINLELSFEGNYLFMFFYGDENSYSNLCKLFDYQLQLQPVAINYENKKNNNNKKKEISNLENEYEPLLDKMNIKDIQFQDFDINNPVYWPPYFTFDENKKSKFIKYTKNDDFYFDNNESNNDNISIFRNIDKLRLIYSSLTQIIKFSELQKASILEMIFIKRNNIAYENKLKELDIKNIYNPFDYKKCDKAINIMRNYYGENVSYYFLWIDNYVRWLLLPSIVGILIFISYYIWKKIPLISIFSNRIEMNYYDLLLILNCCLLSLWLTLFIKTWIQKEKVYNYIWGMRESDDSKLINDDFEPDSEEKLIFGYYVPIAKKTNQQLKKILSYFVLLGMIFIVLVFIYYLFRIKASLLNGNQWHDYKISVIIACINGLQIKLVNLLYYYVAKYLNEWENHFTINKKTTSFAQKLILFDFLNSYSSLFYIAFIKPYNEGCVNNNCLKELETQMYSIFFIYVAVFIFELVYLYGIYYYNKKKLGNINIGNSLEIQGLEHQMMMSPMEDINLEYNDIINQFGYVCLFSVAAPLTPLIVFLLAIINRITNYYKFVHLKRIDTLWECNGISFYKDIIKIFLFVGIMVNVAIFLFTNSQISPLDNNFELIKGKFLTIGIVENSLLLIYFSVNWNRLPKWFKYKNIIRKLYLNKFFKK